MKCLVLCNGPGLTPYSHPFLLTSTALRSCSATRRIADGCCGSGSVIQERASRSAWPHSSIGSWASWMCGSSSARAAAASRPSLSRGGYYTPWLIALLYSGPSSVTGGCPLCPCLPSITLTLQWRLLVDIPEPSTSGYYAESSIVAQSKRSEI